MELKGYRLRIIIIVAVLAFALFFLGQSLYQRYLVLAPLLKQVQAIEGVEEIQVLPREEGQLFQVKLAEVGDLSETYRKVNGKLKSILGDKPYQILVLDQRNEELDRVYYLVHFAVYEAIARGNFTYLADKVTEEAEAHGMKQYRVFVDSERVYLQLHLPDAYLYEVIPRQVQRKEGIGID